MHRVAFSLPVVVSLLLGAFPASSQQLPVAAPEEVGMSSERLERLDATMQRFIDDDLVTGTVTLVAREFPNLVMQAITESRHTGEQPIRAYDELQRE